MLVLSRHPDETVVIRFNKIIEQLRRGDVDGAIASLDRGIDVMLVAIVRNDKARLGFEGPCDIEVYRSEVYDRVIDNP